MNDHIWSRRRPCAAAETFLAHSGQSGETRRRVGFMKPMFITCLLVLRGGRTRGATHVSMWEAPTLQDLRLGFPKRPYFGKIQWGGDSWRTVERVDWELVKIPKNGPQRDEKATDYIFQRFVTSRHFIGFSKIRTFWKAKTQNLKCLKVVMCRKRGPRDDRYRWKSSKSVLAFLSTCYYLLKFMCC